MAQVSSPAGATVALVAGAMTLWPVLRARRERTGGMSAKGKVVIATGGLSGLGKEIAELYRVNGALVAVLDIDDEVDMRQSPIAIGLGYFKCDISDQQEVEAIMSTIQTDMGRQNVLMNCAAMSINRLSFHDLPIGLFAKTVNTNLLGPAHTI
ncbi:NAD(P)-binding protein [Aspergillus aculeatinus CBS 121060]|uniref:NAD(P)-binding protein n=1 Tax=Aspergillus aculeatinus CBS 121060 TaxID=1448322 RepID=A0ACD1H8V6_9EURO|nr:NAD(P)-binding protein [Aspergillus aculeatinus CBS 121060]RAH69846.1 NAD(P)-binding protein [Aspergillus aculeatinus CBS 121060]